MVGDLVEFPNTRSCFNCVHIAMTGTGGSFCLVFNDPIYNEKKEAEDCEVFTPQ